MQNFEVEMFLIPEIQFVKLNTGSYVMMNLINAAADIVDEDHYTLLTSAQFSKIDRSTIELLCNRRYLFKTQSDYHNFLNGINEKISTNEKKLAPNFLIIPTYACNLSCVYCYEQTYEIQKMLNHKYKDLFDQQLAFIDEFAQTNSEINSEDITVTLMGGEPLLKANIQIIEYILDALHSRSFRINVVTNGVDLDAFLDLLIQYKVDHLQVTLDGTEKTHDKRRIFKNGIGSFEKILNNVTQAIEKGIKIYLRVNVDRENVDDLPALADLLVKKFKKSDLLYPYVYLLQDGGCSGEKNVLQETDGIKHIFELAKKHPNMAIFYKKYHPAGFLDAILNNKHFQPLLTHCGAARNQYILDVKGNIYRCWHGIGNDKYAVGTMKDMATFNEKNALWQDRTILKMEKCKKCKYRYLCGTGCPAATHFSETNFDITKPSCVDYENLLNTLISLQFNEEI